MEAPQPKKFTVEGTVMLEHDLAGVLGPASFSTTVEAWDAEGAKAHVRSLASVARVQSIEVTKVS